MTADVGDAKLLAPVDGRRRSIFDEIEFDTSPMVWTMPISGADGCDKPA